jgi:hypothetical protein
MILNRNKIINLILAFIFCQLAFKNNIYAVATDFTSDYNNVSSSGDYSGYTPSMAVDDNNSTPWIAPNAVKPYDHWIKLEFNTAYVVSEIKWLPEYKRVKDWVLWGSNDDSDWDNLGSGVGGQANAWNDENISNTESYTYYKFQVTTDHEPTNTETMFYELQLWGEEGSTPTETPTPTPTPTTGPTPTTAPNVTPTPYPVGTEYYHQICLQPQNYAYIPANTYYRTDDYDVTHITSPLVDLKNNNYNEYKLIMGDFDISSADMEYLSKQEFIGVRSYQQFIIDDHITNHITISNGFALPYGQYWDEIVYQPYTIKTENPSCIGYQPYNSFVTYNTNNAKSYSFNELFNEDGTSKFISSVSVSGESFSLKSSSIVNTCIVYKDFDPDNSISISDSEACFNTPVLPPTSVSCIFDINNMGDFFNCLWNKVKLFFSDFFKHLSEGWKTTIQQIFTPNLTYNLSDQAYEDIKSMLIEKAPFAYVYAPIAYNWDDLSDVQSATFDFELPIPIQGYEPIDIQLDLAPSTQIQPYIEDFKTYLGYFIILETVLGIIIMIRKEFISEQLESRDQITEVHQPTYDQITYSKKSIYK